jgi:hypothetical protein
MVLCCNQNVGQNQNLVSANKSFENAANVEYLETTVTNKKSIDEEIKKRLKRGMLASILFRAS